MSFHGWRCGAPNGGVWAGEQDAVRAEFPELSKLLIDRGGKVYQDGNVRHLLVLAVLICSQANAHVCWMLQLFGHQLPAHSSLCLLMHNPSS